MDYKVYLEDVLHSVDQILKYTQGMDQNTFEQDDKTVDAVVRNLEIIGEAVKNIPDSIRDQYPDIEWRKMIGLRDILIHEYFGVDMEIVWDIVQNKLPDLKKQVEKMISDGEQP